MNKLNQLIEKAKEDIKSLGNEINSHIEKYGTNTCDYLIHRQCKLMFHKGELNALTKLKNIGE